MDYFVVSSESIPGLQGRVEDLIELGYKPQGGVAVTNLSGTIVLFQAMVRDEEKKHLFLSEPLSVTVYEEYDEDAMVSEFTNVFAGEN